MRPIKTIRALSVLVALVAAFAAYACTRPDAGDAPTASPPTAARPAVVDAPWSIVRERDALVTTGRRPLAARFADVVTITRGTDGQRVGIRGASVGRANAMTKLAAARAELEGERVAYAKGSVREWYAMTTNGVEQGFTIATRPAGAGSLRVDVMVDEAMEVVASDDHATLDLRKRGEAHATFRYGALSAQDATGATLASSMERVDAGTIRLVVDDARAEYPITIDPLVWALQQQLTRLTGRPGDQFGYSVAVQGETVVVAANGVNEYRGGAAVFERSGEVWHQTTFLVPTDAGPGGAGNSLTLAGDWAIVGSANPAFAYRRAGVGWHLNQTITTEMRVEYPAGYNGANVALDKSGTTLAVSTPLVFQELLDGGEIIDGGTLTPASLAYLFGNDGGVWERHERIVLPELPRVVYPYGPIAIDADAIAVGNGTHVFVYRRGPNGWGLEATLEGSRGPSALDFGRSVALSGNTLAVGTREERTVYIFVRDSAGWTIQQKLFVPVAAQFGDCVALVDDVLLVGDDYLGTKGAAYHFRRAAGAWSLVEHLEASSGINFGCGLALSATTAVIGDASRAGSQGAAYVYTQKSALGDPCKAPVSCASGHCVEGVCCDEACGLGIENNCLSCQRLGHIGHCGPAPVNVECRPARDACDVAERCDGEKSACPADLAQPNGTACAAGVCAAGRCRASESTNEAAERTSDTTNDAQRGCTTAPASRGTSGPYLSGVLVLLLLRRKRRLGACLPASALIALVVLVEPPLPRRIDEALEVESPLQRLRVRLDRTHGVTTDDQHQTRFGMTLTSFGRSGATCRPTSAVPGRVGDRIEADRGVVREWYRAVPRGIEHGFDVVNRPPGTGFLALQLAVDGDYMPVDRHGRVQLEANSPTHTLVYGELVARDDRGQSLPATIHVEGRSLSIEIDDRLARYPVVIDPLVWRVHQVLVHASPKPNDFYGYTLKMRGSTALVASFAEGGYDASYGTVHVLQRTRTAWSETQRLDPAEKLVVDAAFGSALGLASDTLVVGAPGQRAVFVFEQRGNKWLRTQRLTATDPQEATAFGTSLAIEGDTLLVGAPAEGGAGPGGNPGAVYVFARLAGVWTQRTKLLAPGFPGLGACVALSGNTALAGAWLGSVHTLPDTAHFFVGASAEWTHQETFATRVEGGGYDYFGCPVAIDGDIAAVGGSWPQKGASGGYVKIYRRTNAVWEEAQTLRAPDPVYWNGFGDSVAIHGTRLAVGAAGANDQTGAVYLFDSTPTDVIHRESLVSPRPTTDAYFGSRFDFAGDMFLVGDFFRDEGRGGVDVFFHGSEGDPCTSGDICNSGLCIDGVCCDSKCGDGDPNDCMACSMAAGGAKDGVCGPAKPHLCRAARGECDVAESCDGRTMACPADVVVTNGTVCSAGAGLCTSGECKPPAAPNEAAPVPVADAPATSSCSTSPRGAYGGLAMIAAIAAVAVARRRRRS